MKTFSSGLESFCCDNKQLPTTCVAITIVVITNHRQRQLFCFDSICLVLVSKSETNAVKTQIRWCCARKETKEHWLAAMLRPPKTSRRRHGFCDT